MCTLRFTCCTDLRTWDLYGRDLDNRDEQQEEQFAVHGPVSLSYGTFCNLSISAEAMMLSISSKLAVFTLKTMYDRVVADQTVFEELEGLLI